MTQLDGPKEISLPCSEDGETSIYLLKQYVQVCEKIKAIDGVDALIVRSAETLAAACSAKEKQTTFRVTVNIEPIELYAEVTVEPKSV